LDYYLKIQFSNIFTLPLDLKAEEVIIIVDTASRVGVEVIEQYISKMV
jgi:hypothetical protein